MGIKIIAQFISVVDLAAAGCGSGRAKRRDRVAFVAVTAVTLMEGETVECFRRLYYKGSEIMTRRTTLVTIAARTLLQYFPS